MNEQNEDCKNIRITHLLIVTKSHRNYKVILNPLLQYRGFLNQLSKCGQILKNKPYFFNWKHEHWGKSRPGKFHHPKSFDFIFVEEKVFKFRNFLSDLEIAETFENAITDALIRSPNLRLKKYGLFLKICPDIPKFQ